MFRLIQTLPRLNAKGLVVGFGIPKYLDKSLIDTLPKFGIVCTDKEPATVTIDNFRSARLLTKAPLNVPLVLLGCTKGTSSVAAALVAHTYVGASRSVQAIALLQADSIAVDRDVEIFKNIKNTAFVGTCTTKPESEYLISKIIGLDSIDPEQAFNVPGCYVALVAESTQIDVTPLTQLAL